MQNENPPTKIQARIFDPKTNIIRTTDFLVDFQKMVNESDRVGFKFISWCIVPYSTITDSRIEVGTYYMAEAA